MKKIVCIALSLVCTVTAFSQSAKQIVSQMQEYVKAHESEGLSYTEEVGYNMFIVIKQHIHQRTIMVSPFSLILRQQKT